MVNQVLWHLDANQRKDVSVSFQCSGVTLDPSCINKKGGDLRPSLEEHLSFFRGTKMMLIG